MPTWLHVSCELSFDVRVPTPMTLMLRPRSDALQWVAREHYRLSPTVQVRELTDPFGNLSQRLVAPVGPFLVQTAADVLVSPAPAADEQAPFVEVQSLPDDVLPHLLPSRYCESDRFGDMAADVTRGLAPGYPQVAAITAWVRANVRNRPLSSTYPVSATEVNQRREGVCRDLAQIGIALCRALCIPARLAVGYLHELEPMDVHAWFEAYLGGRWYTFDPAVPPGLDNPRIVIARGRDAADVAIYNQYGPLLLPEQMHVAVEKTRAL